MFVSGVAISTNTVMRTVKYSGPEINIVHDPAKPEFIIDVYVAPVYPKIKLWGDIDREYAVDIGLIRPGASTGFINYSEVSGIIYEPVFINFILSRTNGNKVLNAVFIDDTGAESETSSIYYSVNYPYSAVINILRPVATLDEDYCETTMKFAVSDAASGYQICVVETESQLYDEATPIVAQEGSKSVGLYYEGDIRKGQIFTAVIDGRDLYEANLGFGRVLVKPFIKSPGGVWN